MSTKIYQLNQVDIKKIGYDGPYDVESIGKFTYINYEKQPLIVQTPTLLLGDTINRKENILYVPLIGKSSRITNYVNEFFTNIDKKITMDIEKNAKPLGIETGDFHYNPIIQTHATTQKPYIVFKLINKNSFETLVFDDTKKLISPDNYLKKLETSKFIKLIFSISSFFVNFKKKSIDINFKVYQIKLTDIKQLPLTNPIKEYSFIDSDSQLHDLIRTEIDAYNLIGESSSPEKDNKEKEENKQIKGKNNVTPSRSVGFVSGDVDEDITKLVPPNTKNVSEIKETKAPTSKSTKITKISKTTKNKSSPKEEKKVIKRILDDDSDEATSDEEFGSLDESSESS